MTLPDSAPKKPFVPSKLKAPEELPDFSKQAGQAHVPSPAAVAGAESAQRAVEFSQTGLPPGYSPAPSSPEQLPNYDRTTGTERWITGLLPHIPKPLTDTLEWFSNTGLGKVLTVLDVGAEGLERTIGFTGQWLDALDQGTLDEFKKNAKAAWYAGSLAADVNNMTLAYNPETRQWSAPRDLPGLAGLVQARARIAELTGQGMSYKDALAQTRGEYYNSLGALAIRATLNDTALHMLADPLNVLLPFISPVERAALAAKIARTKSTATILAEATTAAELAAKNVGAATDALRAAETTKDAAKISAAQDALADAQRLANIATAEREASRVSQMGRAERLLYDVLGGDLTRAPKPNKLLDSWAGRIFRLSPAARAHEARVMINNFLDVAVFGPAFRGKTFDPLEAKRILQRVLDGTTDPRLAAMVTTPAGRATRAYLATGVEKMGDIADAWGAAQKAGSIGLMRFVQTALGQTGPDILKQLNNGEGAALYARFMEVVRKYPDLGMEFDRFLSGLGRTGELTQEGFEALFGPLRTGGNLHLYDQSWVAAAMRNALDDVAAQHAIVEFGVKQRGFWSSLSNALKSAESLVFMRLNPVYPIRNYINNFFTMVARGVFGNPFDPTASGIVKRLGLDPVRMAEGFGPAGEAGAIAREIQKIRSGADVISDALRNKTGAAGFFDRISDSIRGVNVPFDASRIAQSIEAAASQRAFSTALGTFWNKHWRPGGEFLKRIGDIAPNFARALGRDAAGTLERSVAGAANDAELDALIRPGNLNTTPGNLRLAFEDEIGAKLDDVLGAETSEWLTRDASDALNRGGLPELQRFMETASGRINAALDEAHADKIKVLIDQVAARAEAGGAETLAGIWSKYADDLYQFRLRHTTDTALFAEEARRMSATPEGLALRDSRWRSKFIDDELHWKRKDAEGLAVAEGLERGFAKAGWGDAGPIKRAMKDLSDSRREFFTYRNEQYANFRWNDAEPGAWDALQADLNARYEALIAKERQYAEVMDRTMASLLPPEKQANFLAFREQVRKLREDDMLALLDMRESLRGKNQAQIVRAHREFLQKRLGALRAAWQVDSASWAAAAGDPRAASLVRDRAMEIYEADQMARGAAEKLRGGKELTPEEGEALRDFVRGRASPEEAERMDALKSVSEGKTTLTPEELAALPNRRVQGDIRAIVDKIEAGVDLTPEETKQVIQFAKIASKNDVSGLPTRLMAVMDDMAGRDLPYKMAIDLDYLKWFNDSAGHAQGDVLLKAFGEELKRVAGKRAFHISGDEFYADFATEAERAAARADLEATMRRRTFRLENKTTGDIYDVSGITFGVGEATGTGAAGRKAADEALSVYKAAAKDKRAAVPAGAVRVVEGAGGGPVGGGAERLARAEYQRLAREILDRELGRPGKTPPAQIVGMDDIDPPQVDVAGGLDDLYYQRGRDMLSQFERAAEAQYAKAPFKWSGLSPEQQAEGLAYIEHAKSAMARAKMAGVGHAETMRDSALLNYNRQLNFDNMLGVVMPYEFWSVHSVFNWALWSIDRPAMLSSYLRIHKLLSTGGMYQPGTPSRLRGKVKVNMPFAPDWAGDQFVDPLQLALPMKQWGNIYDQYIGQGANDQAVTERMLGQLLNDQQISQSEYEQAMQTKMGPVWERAISLARQDDTEGRKNALDFAAMLSSPHVPLAYAYNALRGKPEENGAILPITRTISDAANLLGLEPNAWYNPEAAIRAQMGLDPLGKWDDYYIKRMLANMIGEDVGGHPLTAAEARQAMIDQRGPAWDAARKRAGIEQAGADVVGFVLSNFIGLNVTSYPPGEERLRSLDTEHRAALAADRGLEDGDKHYAKDFYAKHPEYAARRALFGTPEEQMRSFLYDAVWAKYNALPDLNQSIAREALGPLFEQSFLNRETRNFDNVSVETLGMWARMLGSDTPGALDVKDVVSPAYAPPEIAARAQAYYDTLRNNFPAYYEQADVYYALDTKARKAYRRAHPDFNMAYEWREDFLRRNPDVSPYLTDKPPKYKSEAEAVAAQQNQPNLTQQEWLNVLGGPAYRLALDAARGERMPEALRQRLMQYGDPDAVAQMIAGAQ